MSCDARTSSVSFDARAVSQESPHTPPSAAAAAVNAVNLLNGTTSGDVSAPTAAETATAAASASAAAAASRSNRFYGGAPSSNASAGAAAAAATLGAGQGRGALVRPSSPIPLHSIQVQGPEGHAEDYRNQSASVSPRSPPLSELSSIEPEETASLAAPLVVTKHLGATVPSAGEGQNSDVLMAAEDSSGSVPGMRAAQSTNRKSHHKAWQEHLQTMQVRIS